MAWCQPELYGTEHLLSFGTQLEEVSHAYHTGLINTILTKLNNSDEWSYIYGGVGLQGIKGRIETEFIPQLQKILTSQYPTLRIKLAPQGTDLEFFLHDQPLDIHEQAKKEIRSGWHKFLKKCIAQWVAFVDDLMRTPSNELFAKLNYLKFLHNPLSGPYLPFAYDVEFTNLTPDKIMEQGDEIEVLEKPENMFFAQAWDSVQEYFNATIAPARQLLTKSLNRLKIYREEDYLSPAPDKLRGREAIVRDLLRKNSGIFDMEQGEIDAMYNDATEMKDGLKRPNRQKVLERLKRVYKKRVLATHSDKEGGSDEQFRTLNEAWKKLQYIYEE